MPPMPKAPMLKPFRYGTRRRTQFIQSVLYNGLSSTARPPLIEIPKVGYLAAIELTVRGQLDFGAAGVIGPDGIAGIFDNVQLLTNIGSTQLVDVSGAGLDWLNRVIAKAGDRSRRLAIVAGAGTTPVEWHVRVPVNANMGRNFELGLINLQDPQIQVGLKLQFAPLTSVISTATTGGATTITVDVHYTYFEVPDPRQFYQPPRVIMRSVEEPLQNLVVGPGRNVYEVPREGTLLEFAGIVYINGVRAPFPDPVTGPPAVQEILLRFNKTDVIEDRTAHVCKLFDGINYGFPIGNIPGGELLAGAAGTSPIVEGISVPSLLVDGAYTFDFWNAEGLQASGDLRDAIDTELLTTTEFIYILDPAANVQPTDTIRNVRRIFQKLA